MQLHRKDSAKMKSKRTKLQKQGLSHLENAIYETPPASANDHTGYMPYRTPTEAESESISEMMNVPSQPQKTKYPKKDRNPD